MIHRDGAESVDQHPRHEKKREVHVNPANELGKHEYAWGDQTWRANTPRLRKD
jgi:hypothetical protein